MNTDSKPAEQWKQFAAAARLDIKDDELARILGPVEALFAGTRQALSQDLGFAPPVVLFRFPGEQR